MHLQHDTWIMIAVPLLLACGLWTARAWNLRAFVDLDLSVGSIGESDAVFIMRKQHVHLIGGDFARDIESGLMDAMDHGNDMLEPPYMSHDIRIGSSVLSYRDITVEGNEDLEGDLNDAVHQAKKDATMIILYFDAATIQSMDMTKMHLLSQIPTVPTFFFVQTAPDGMDSCDPAVQESHDAMMDWLSSEILAHPRLQIISFGKEVTDYHDECTLNSTVASLASTNVLRTMESMYKAPPLTASQYALVFFFSPLLVAVVVMETIHLLMTHTKARSAKGSPYDMMDEDSTSDIEMSTDLASPSSEASEQFDQGSSTSWYRTMAALNAWYAETQGRKVGLAIASYALVLSLCYFFDTGSQSLMHFEYRLRDQSLSAWLVFMAIAFLASLVRIKTLEEGDIRNTDVKPLILSRQMTEEWKGFMQLGFLLYHYFHAVETYNLIRLFIASYVWMTGYGNFMYFYHKKDFSLSRVLHMVWRINLFVLFLCMTMNNAYMEYYICALHTCFFLVVYVIMLPSAPAFRRPNRDRVIGISILAAVVWITLLFEVDAIWNAVMYPFPWFYINGSLHEWRFRSTLDHYATLVGIVTAYFLPSWSRLQKRLDSLESRTKRIGIKLGITAALGIAMAVFANNYVFSTGKYEYNATHPYTSWFPITAFLLLRNLTPWLRTHYAAMFSWLGKITLETYLLQYHVWLTDNAKVVLTFVDGSEWINFGLTSVMYIMLAYITFHATTTLTQLLVPPKVSQKEVLVRNCSFAFVMLLCWGFGSAVAA